MTEIRPRQTLALCQGARILPPPATAPADHARGRRRRARPRTGNGARRRFRRRLERASSFPAPPADETPLPTVPAVDDASNAPNRLAAFFALLPEKERSALICFISICSTHGIGRSPGNQSGRTRPAARRGAHAAATTQGGMRQFAGPGILGAGGPDVGLSSPGGIPGRFSILPIFLAFPCVVAEFRSANLRSARLFAPMAVLFLLPTSSARFWPAAGRRVTTRVTRKCARRSTPWRATRR